ncbi:mucin-4 [Petaurus breviceps papuanus]|uniref:mucin-4 n=1 Tax=Petaurus breviceps papuanus TaxID=3040969 RepID=UPI0036DBE73A
MRVDFTVGVFRPQIGFPFGSKLRDFLYFTDNGHIIFPPSEFDIFSYPNPPPRGFTENYKLATVAAFWDDADFSSGRGEIFYQEYNTFYGEEYSFLKEVESQIQKFTGIQYEARWTLKITWVKAPPYPAQRISGDNTFQAILTTDGSLSFALILYQNGGMQWAVPPPSAADVLIGFSSGDGFFFNDPLTSRPPEEKYRPDQVKGSETGLRGFQIYRLQREWDIRPNYRLKCLQWLKQNSVRGWNWNLFCPCSWQQGVWDLRFQPVTTGSINRRQLCSFSSWRGSICCVYGIWGELRDGWSIQNPWDLDQEMEAQNWCCRWNDKPFLCYLYQQKRPPVSCIGYRPPRPAWMFGDPHITTLDGANYTFNGLGDFLLVQAKDGNSSFLLHGRTAKMESAQATKFVAFAARYQSNLINHTVHWFLMPNDTIQVQLDNENVTFMTHSNFSKGKATHNASGILLIQNGSLISASFDGTVVVSVLAVANILQAVTSLPEEYQNHTEGLLGVWNNNIDDDFRMSNGSSIPSNSTEEEFFHYGMTWNVNGKSLFANKHEDPSSNFTPIFLSELIKNKTVNKDWDFQCNNSKQCLYDALATGDLNIGKATSSIFRNFKSMNGTLNQLPPMIDGETLIHAYMGKTQRLMYRSNDPGATFILHQNSSDIIFRGNESWLGSLFFKWDRCSWFPGLLQLTVITFCFGTESGTLLWTPRSMNPFYLELLVRNTQGLSSVLQLQAVLCNCSNENQCNYSDSSRLPNSSLQVAACNCNQETSGFFCERRLNSCGEGCYPGVACDPVNGCGPCPKNMTGDGRHCASCETLECPQNYCFNEGKCFFSPNCQPTCVCPPAFVDDRCLIAGNSFTPTMLTDIPLRIIRLFLSEREMATLDDVNATVTRKLEFLEGRAFLKNSPVTKINTSGPVQKWEVIAEFQYLPEGSVIDFLNHRLEEAVRERFWKLDAPSGISNPRKNVSFLPVTENDISSVKLLEVDDLKKYFSCNDSYPGYHLVYNDKTGFSCVSPCAEGYCKHGGLCQHQPSGPKCSCGSYSIYSPSGERCEHLGIRLGAFFGILFGALGAFLLLGVGTFLILRYCRNSERWYTISDSER